MRILLILLLSTAFSSQIQAQDCPDSCEICAPRTITPDADCADCDVFKIASTCNFEEYDLKIYNRWGELIFESLEPDDEFSCADVKDSGVYVWKFVATYCNGEEIELVSHLNVIK